MRNILIFFVIAFPEILLSQRVTISSKLTSNNVVFRLIKNPIYISFENYNCRKIVVKADKGNLNGSNCNYIYTLTDSGYSRDKIRIGIKKGFKVKWIDSAFLEVRNLSDPVVFFAMAADGDSIPKAYIQANSCIFSAPDR